MSADPAASTSFDCLHPVSIEERGRVKADDEATFKVTLQDCLACSGCAITKDEITIISEQNTSRIFEKLDEVKDYIVLVATHVVANLAAVRNWSAAKAFSTIKQLFLSKGAQKVVLDTDIQLVFRRLVVKEFIENQTLSPFMISRCAGSVVYYERKTSYADHLAQIKPYPQLYAMYEKKILQSTNYVLYIGPCYDRKLEAARFEEDVDAVLTIAEINDHITEPTEEIPVKFPADTDLNAISQKLGQIKDSLNSDSIYQLIAEIEPTLNEEEINSLISELPSRFDLEISTNSFDGETLNKRLTKTLDMMSSGKKVPKPAPRLAQIDFCKGGCLVGGGQIRGNSPAQRRALIAATQEVHTQNESTNISFPTELYNELIKFGYKTHYESLPQEEEKDQFAW
ncbi:hypothetical protein TVAG_129510 [Trichomonas vaginalis G3]|uniref:Iron hydrogenase large subunit C-terminal domain-containing protein n=1 Tax=Trichomonas vaginalis (strain ATCC PRA-98 / G3) TaxID=412133 RepID=A2DI47_TRIV3|nr:iron-sulfur cluster assembly [Trichomonas vaginalis G3]EAY19843.1 hypothetical protein TVAG_129510 [Trichomonas vaginalis G3]KAI5510029.1 iron-sulfur cluster assembly [Trichomonas vaginalis G3]|eukprot:XP_001580829.1 hypothetical protein [Trichomonas vaginalis G3]